MCGIAGFVDFNKEGSLELLKKMSDTILHRGPDDSGNELFETNQAQIGFGFRRLAIIELSSLGHQPMHFQSAQLTVIFNGEIYNFKEIRTQLEKIGYVFESNSDTEVILKSYAHWGVKCVDRFIGMYAFAIYDIKNEKVVLFRDRAGVKPLFYYHQNDLFLFGSELKIFHVHPLFKKEINYSALSLYFQRGYISAPHTIFQNTFKVLPGHFLQIDLKTKQVSEHKYWDVVDCYNQPKLDISFEEAKAETEKLMLSAFQYRMVSDVPVGVFLSGGYDSTAVTALLQKNATSKIKTFTIGFHDPKFNEAPHAKKVAEYLGTQHFEYICTHKDALDIVAQLPHIYDEPFGDTSAIPTILVSRMARQHVTVALSADGGDEIFAGYPKYINAAKRIEQLNQIPNWLQTAFSKITPISLQTGIFAQNKWSKLHDYLQNKDAVKRFDIISQATTFYETQKLFNHPIQQLHTPFEDGSLLDSSNDLISKFQAIEYKTYMADDILQKVDRATMSVSLEGREPFLDHRIIEFAARLPISYKLKKDATNQFTSKYILKQIVHNYVPPKLMERPKMGFAIPLENWLRKELKEIFLDVLDEATLRKQNIFNVAHVIQLRDKYLNGETVEFQRLSYIFLFQLWYKKWMQ